MSKTEQKPLKVITLEELQKHNEKADTKWLVVEGRVVDVSIYQYEHPGGADILLENCGKDATEPFSNAGHTDSAKQTLFKFVVGILEGHSESTPLKVLAPAPKKTVSASSSSAGGFNFGLIAIPLVILGVLLFYFSK